MKRFLLVGILFFLTIPLAVAGDKMTQAARRAIADNSISLLTALLQAGLRVDDDIAEEPHENEEITLSPLMLAVAWNRPVVVKWLLENGAMSEFYSYLGVRPIDVAIAMDNKPMCELLRLPAENEKIQDRIGEVPEKIWEMIFQCVPHQEKVIFVEWDKKDPPDELIRLIESCDFEAYPLSHGKAGTSSRSSKDRQTFVWYWHRLTDKPGAKVSVVTQLLEDGKGCAYTLTVDGAPQNVPNTKSIMDAEKTVFEKKGNITKQYGWWCFDHENIPLAAKFPDLPANDAKRIDLIAAASEAIYGSNIHLLTALYDAGLNISDNFGDESIDYVQSALDQTVTYNRPRVAAFLLNRFPELRQNRAVMWSAASGAYEEGESEILQLLTCTKSEEVISGYSADLLKDFAISAGIGSRGSKELSFISWNGGDPDPKIEALLTKVWPNALKFSEAEVGDFSEGDQSSNFRHKTSKKLGSKFELELIKESETVYHYSIRETRGFLAGGGQKGKLVSAYGYWLKTESSSWDE
ncbi:hypothetical protein BH11VER1_BH11VER1_28920 [soil metagenome]